MLLVKDQRRFLSKIMPVSGVTPHFFQCTDNLFNFNEAFRILQTVIFKNPFYVAQCPIAFLPNDLIRIQAQAGKDDLYSFPFQYFQ